MDAEELRTLAATENSGIFIKKVNIHMSLQPTALGNTEQKADQELERRLYRYHKDFDGMLLYYEDVAVKKKGGSIHIDEDGFPHINVKVKAFIFRPVKGVETVASVVEEHSNLIDCRLFDNIYLTVIKNQSNVKLEPTDVVRVVLTDVMHHQHRTKLHANILSVVSQTAPRTQNTKISFGEEEEYTEDKLPKIKAEPVTDPSEGEEDSKSSKKKKKRKERERDENLNIPTQEVEVKKEIKTDEKPALTSVKKKKKDKRDLEEQEETEEPASPVKKK